MHPAQVQLSKSSMSWSKKGCLGFLQGGGCLKRDGWNVFRRCPRAAAVLRPRKESGSWAGRTQPAFRWPRLDRGSHKEQFIVVVCAVLRAGHRAPAPLLLDKQSYDCEEFIKSSPVSRSRIWWELGITAPGRAWPPANPPASSKNTFRHARFARLTRPQTSTPGGKRRAGFLGQHRANLQLWKNDGRDTTGKSLSWERCSPSHLRCQPGLYWSPSASRCGMNHCSSLMKQQAVNAFPCVI